MEWPKDLLGDPSYSAMVLGAVAEGRFEHTFVPITIEAGGHTGTFQVSQDALKIDGVRINASAVLQQHIADLLGAYLLTPKLLDQMWAQRAVTLTPCPQPIATTSAAMIRHSTCVDAKLTQAGGAPSGGIVQTVGKTWVITNTLLEHPGKACNDGWHLERPMGGQIPFDPAPTLPDAHMIQSPGYHHDSAWIDYSQLVLLVHRDCTGDSSPMTFADVARSPILSPLINAGGVLRVLRQPGVPELITSPVVRSAPPGAATIALMGVGVGIGASIAGGPGALVGGALGWAADAVRRKLLT
jgi:hypothetical protein